jgi:hypothetical protein
MPLESDEFAILDPTSRSDGERLCSEECRKEYDAAADDDKPRKHHDDCNCTTCHNRWRTELNK